MPTQDVLVQLAAYRPPVRDDLPEAAPSDPAEREAALSGVLDEVLADADAAAAAPAALYQDFTLRCRVRRLEAESIGLPEFKRRLAARRAGGTLPDGPEWAQAQAVAAGLPDDLAGPFLLIARAAIEGLPCPSDAALAEAYGTSSAGRARRMLAYLEERGAIVVRRGPARRAGHRRARPGRRDGTGRAARPGAGRPALNPRAGTAGSATRRRFPRIRPCRPVACLSMTYARCSR